MSAVTEWIYLAVPFGIALLSMAGLAWMCWKRAHEPDDPWPCARPSLYSYSSRLLRMEQEIDHLRRLNEGLAERVAQQSDLLSRRAEKAN